MRSPRSVGQILLFAYIILLPVAVCRHLRPHRPVIITVYEQPGHEREAAQTVKAIAQHLGLPGFAGR